MKRSHLALLLALNCGWAATPTLATRLEGYLGAVEFVLLRYGFALVALLAVWPWLPGSIPRGRDAVRSCIMGIAVFSVGQLAQIGGIQRSQASDASILLALDPLVSTLAAAWFLHETVPGRRWVGFGLAIAGVFLMSAGRSAAALPGLLANLLIVFSFTTEAAWSVMGKPLITRWGIPKVSILALVAGTLANLVIAAFSLERPLATTLAGLPPGGWAALAFVGVVMTAFGYNAWFVVIREAPVGAASMTIYLQPVVGSVLAFALTGEKPDAGHLAGCVAIAAGLAVGLRDGASGTTPPSPDP